MGNWPSRAADAGPPVVAGWAAPETLVTAADITRFRTRSVLSLRDGATDEDGGSKAAALEPAGPTPVLLAAGDLARNQVRLASRRLLAVSPELGLDIRLQTICSLHLENNHLESLPSSLACLVNLRVLNISQNRFTRLPECVFEMRSLLQLDADHNQIKALDRFDDARPFGGLGRLVSLSLVGNAIAHVPAGLARIEGLVHLDLSGNPLRALPCEIGRMRYLQHLVLDECPLHTLESWAAEQAQAAPPPAVPSLLELTARAMVRAGLPYHPAFPAPLADYMYRPKVCSGCRGPFFDQGQASMRISLRNGYEVPWVYRLCSEHWHDDASRIRFMFSPPGWTAAQPPPPSAEHNALVAAVYRHLTPADAPGAARVVGVPATPPSSGSLLHVPPSPTADLPLPSPTVSAGTAAASSSGSGSSGSSTAVDSGRRTSIADGKSVAQRLRQLANVGGRRSSISSVNEPEGPSLSPITAANIFSEQPLRAGLAAWPE